MEPNTKQPDWETTQPQLCPTCNGPAKLILKRTKIKNPKGMVKVKITETYQHIPPEIPNEQSI